MRKQSSTNLENELLINGNCDMAYTLDLIGGRWKPSILWRLVSGPMRYSDLRRSLPAVSERILILQLRTAARGIPAHRARQKPRTGY